MDVKIERVRWFKKPRTLFFAALGLLVLMLIFFNLKNIFAHKIPISEITVAQVEYAPFQEYIPVTGVVSPVQSFYMDAIEGGIITKICKEPGEQVKKGDVIVELMNSNLQLEVLNREAQLYEQINLMRNTRLLIDQNNLRQQGELAEVDYNLSLLKTNFHNFKILFEKKMISEKDFQEVAEKYHFYDKKKKLILTSYKKDSLSRKVQLVQLDISESRMKRSLEAIGDILGHLTVESPIDGIFSFSEKENEANTKSKNMELQVGQSIKAGDRIGQIDVMNKYKVQVKIDENYLDRIKINLKGSFQYGNVGYELYISKIYPSIVNGAFQVDMEFRDKFPLEIKRGQSMQIRLELGEPTRSILIPIGDYYKYTGGQWVYVFDKSGTRAERRNITIGRKNPLFFEVLEGLSANEKIISSSYEKYLKEDVVLIKND